MKSLPMLASIAAALALAACGTEKADKAQPSAAGSAAVPPEPRQAVPSASAEAGVPATAQGFADIVAASDLFEIESSRLAQTMSNNVTVKQFAEAMVADHTRSSAELKSAALRAASTVTVVPKLTAEQQADLDRLKRAGSGFDILYAELQLAAHEKALGTLQAYAENGDSQPLKEFARKTAIVVAKHFEHAQRLPR